MNYDINTPTQRVFKTVIDLGEFMREQRKQAGFRTLTSAANAFSVGIRFLSECERGKETAEIGKVLNVLHGLGLDLAVVTREPTDSSVSQQSSTKSCAQELELDFPYDWSNSAMSNELLIQNVLRKARFMDILRLVKHFGIDFIQSHAQEFAGTVTEFRIKQILDRIQVGKAMAKR